MTEIDALRRVAAAAAAYSPREDHDWRCEYRTAEKGWKQGDPPVLDCECGYEELQAALDALRELRMADARLIAAEWLDGGADLNVWTLSAERIAATLSGEP